MQLFQTIGSGALVVSLMLAIGLELAPARLLQLRERPRELLGTVLVNLVVLPAVAWLAARGLGLAPEVTIGVMLCAAAPGGPTSALYSSTARADLALAAGMTILLPAIGVLATPLILSMAVELPAGARVPVVPMILTLLLMQVVPLALGMSIRRVRPRLAKRLLPWASGLANAVLGLLVVALTVLKGELLLNLSAATAAVLFGLTILALGLGYAVARRGSVDADDPRASPRAGALVAACRNVSVAIMLASTFFVDPVVDATVLSFGFVTFALPLGLALWWRSGTSRPRATSRGPSTA